MQATSQTWRDLLASGAPLEARAVIAGTVYNDISAPVIVRAAMQDRLGIGNVAAASLSLVIRGAGSIPRSAAVVIETRLNDGANASEWLPQGTFYISRRARDPVTGLLALECYDALLKAQGQAVLEDVFWTTKSGAFITTAGGDRICFYTAPTGDMRSLARFMAALLGLSLDPRSVIRTDPPYEITSPDEGATIRDILSIIAQANGGNWIVTPQNQLRLVPVVDVTGASEATEDAVDVAGVTSGINQSDSAVITGIRGTLDNDAWLIGDDTGVVLDVSITPVIAAEMAEDMLGRRVQAYSLDGAVCDPAAELGDFVRAGVHGEIASALYTQQITLGPACRSGMGAPGGGEITDEYPYLGTASKTLALAKAYARQAAAGAVEELDDSLTQQEIFNRLTDNGAAQGMVLYNGQLYINASYINAGIIANDNNQNNYWNLLTGEFSTKQGTLGDFTIDSHGLSRSGQAGIMNYDIALNLNGIQYQHTNAGNDVDRTRLGYGTLSLARKEEGKGWAISEIYGSQDSDTGASIFKVNVLGEGQDLSKATRIAVTSKDHSDGGALTVQGGLNVTGGVAFGTPLPVASGGTGANTAAGARTNIGAAAASDVTHVYRDVNLISHPLDTSSYVISFETVGKNVYITFRGDSRAHAENEVFMVIPEGFRSGGDRYFPAAINNTACGVLMQSNGNVSIWTSNPASGRIFLSMAYCIE